MQINLFVFAERYEISANVGRSNDDTFGWQIDTSGQCGCATNHTQDSTSEGFFQVPALIGSQSGVMVSNAAHDTFTENRANRSAHIGLDGSNQILSFGQFVFGEFSRQHIAQKLRQAFTIPLGRAKD